MGYVPVQGFAVLCIGVLLAGCAGLKEAGKDRAGVKEERAAQEAPGSPWKRPSLPRNLRFAPQALPILAAVPSVGRITEDPADAAAALSESARRELTASFQAVYIEGLLQGLPLTGVLGGDLVHGWPVKTPRCWAQNWRGADPDAGLNSWGIPALVLALRGIQQGETFIVHGPILDFYGRSGGLGGANGAAGYGAPWSNAYSRNGGVAQLFQYGVITIDPQGSPSFIPWEKEPSSQALPRGGAALEAGSLPEFPGMDEGKAALFRAAWLRETGIRGAPIIPDGPPVYVEFTPGFFGGEEDASLPARGIYLQFFDQGRTVFAGLAAQGLSFAVRVIRPPFLDALLAEKPLPGAENWPADHSPRDGYRGSITGALLEGMARYGFPLTDALPRRGEGLWREAQRFFRGWIEEF